MVLLLGYYIISEMPQTRADVFGSSLTLHTVTAALGVVYLGYLLVHRRLPGGTPIDWPLALVLVSYALATAASVDWRVSLEATLRIVMVVLLFCVLADMAGLRALDLQRSLMLAAAAASFYALWIVGHDYADWLALARSVDGTINLSNLLPPTVPRVHGVSDHPNILAMTLVLVLPFFMVTLFGAGNRWGRAAAGAGLLASALAIFLTLSRGAWLGAIGGLTVTMGGLATQRWPRRVPRLRARLCPSRVLALLLLATLVLVTFLYVAAHWEARPQWLFRASLSPRYDAMSAGFDMLKDRPLLGTGPDTYALLYPEYSGKFPVQAIHSHNGFLQTAIDLGVPGVAAVLLLGGAIMGMLWRTFRRGSDVQRLTAVACAAALTGFLIHNLADAANPWKAPLVALAAVGAIIARTHQEVGGGETGPRLSGPADRPIRRPSRWPMTALAGAPRSLLLVAILAMFAAWARLDSAHFYFQRGLSRAQDGRLLEAVEDADRAADMDSHFAIYQLQAGLTEGQAYLADGPASLLSRAIDHLRRGIDLEPRSAIGYANLARTLQIAGDAQGAREAALQAQRWAGVDEAVVLAAASVLEDLGYTQDAVNVYAAAVSLNASLADSPFWQTSSLRRSHYGEILSRSALGLSPCTEGDLLARASPGARPPLDKDLPRLAYECATKVAASPGDIGLRVQLATILMAQGNDSSAEGHLDYAIAREPDNGAARTALGKWHAAQGDVQKARRQWLLAGQLGDAEGLLLLGDSYPPGQVPLEVMRRAGEQLGSLGSAVQFDLIGYLYYRMKFGRASPVVMLLPGDWQQAVPGQYFRMQEALARWRG